MQKVQGGGRIVVLFFLLLDSINDHALSIRSYFSFRHGAPSDDGGIMGLKPEQGVTLRAGDRLVLMKLSGANYR